jgi:hypothetical protein
LKRAVLADTAPAELRKRIRNDIQRSRRLGRAIDIINRSWVFAAAAAVLLGAIALGTSSPLLSIESQGFLAAENVIVWSENRPHNQAVPASIGAVLPLWEMRVSSHSAAPESRG